MKTLYIVRHSKSDWGSEALKDIDRHLNPKGYADAYFMSNNFIQNHPIPDLLVSSPAIRAMSTALIFARNFNYPERAITIKASIYEANTEDLIKCIAEFDDSKNNIMLFGHNPGLTNLFTQISDSFIDNIPTSGIIGITFEVKTWKDITRVEGKTLFTNFPKEFKP